MATPSERSDHDLIDVYLLAQFAQLDVAHQDSILQGLNVRDLSRWLKNTRSLPKKRKVLGQVNEQLRLQLAVTNLPSPPQAMYREGSRRLRRILGLEPS